MEERKELLFNYIKANEVPILVDFLSGKDIKDAVILPADINISELNGHYENESYVPPKWLKDIIDSEEGRILVIDKIDTISKEEQIKFRELLEQRKVSTFELPKNVVIIVTANEVNEEKVSKEIFSLVAKI